VNKNKRNSSHKKGKLFIDENDDFLTIHENSGLIPRILNDVIQGINEMSDELDDIRITFSFLEIYNEKIRDLLLNTEESNEGGIYIYMNIYMYIYKYMYIYIYLHIYIYMYT
jgi:hypothetical protein